MNNKLAREILALCRSRFEVRFSFVAETEANITLESLHPNPDSGYTIDFTVPTKFLWQRTLAGKLRAFRESREGHTTANPRSSE